MGLCGQTSKLKKSIVSLEKKEKEIHEMMEVAMYRNLILNPEVLDWLEEAKNSHCQTKELLMQLENLHSKCFGIGSCFGKNKLKKEVYETIEEIHCLIKKGQFEQGVAHTISNSKQAGLSSLGPDDEVVGLDLILQRVLNCIQDEKEFKVIGLCGMGGVGKTTLARRVYEELSKQEGNTVIWVPLSKGKGLVHVQNEILGQMQTDPNYNEDAIAKAKKINEILANKTYVLILDDIWEEIDLRKVGIRSPADNGSKVILTTRNKHVCDGMKADEIIAVEPLSDDDAWYLFRKSFVENILDSNMAIQQIARRIVEQCGGLPLAIKVVAANIRGDDDVNKWEKALQQLIKPVGDEKVNDTFSGVLKISYDSLDISVRRCFIHCCLFPEGTLIEKDQLIEQWLGRGFLDNSKSKQGQEFLDESKSKQGKGILDESQSKLTSFRDTGHVIIRELVSRCLLQDKRNFVTMHHLIHHMGISTALKDGNSIVKAGTNVSIVPEFEDREKLETMSLINYPIEKLVNSSRFPKLSTLILSKNKSYAIHPDVFRSFRALTFLDLSWSEIEELPKTIGTLFPLRYLNISHTNLSELPDSIINLVNLEVLDLSYVTQLRAIPSGLLEHLVELKVLNIFHCGYENWGVEEADMLPLGSTALLKELGKLSTLIDLGLSVVGEDGFNKLQSTEKLLHCTRTLSVSQHEKVGSLPLDSIQSMTNLDTLEIYKCDDLLEMKPNQTAWGKEISNQPSFVNLHNVTIKYCWMLTELSWVCLVPKLRSLEVERCNNLKKIVGDDVIDKELESKAAKEIFADLENLYLGYLPQLESIINIPLNLDSLEELKVVSCPLLKKLPLHSKSSPHNLKIIEGDKKWLQELHWEDKITSSALVPYSKVMRF